MQRELINRDELLRQKTTAMEHMKTQLSQSMTNAAKTGQKGAAAIATEENQMKQKLMVATRTAQGLRDENKNLNDKVIELQAKFSGLQASLKTKTVTDPAANQARLDRALKTVEEFKRSNQVLMERVAEAEKRGKPGAGEASPDELRHKLDTAIRVATLKKKESEKLASKVEEMQREDTRLKMEIAKLQLEVKRARAGAGSGSPADPAAGSAPGQKKAG